MAIDNTWTVVRIALWGNSPTTGKPRAHTRIDFSGVLSVEEATYKAQQHLAHKRDYFNMTSYLLNCISTGNFSVTVERTA
jgi:hypothetical protein